jgi:K+-transporting ATPase ATPase B chain
VLAALLITLIPTTIAALLSAIGIAGMDRLVRFNVLAKSGRAVEAAGDIDVLLLDKTGTITVGDRQASQFLPLNGTSPTTLARAALVASLADETPEGRSIVRLAQEAHGLEAPEVPAGAEVIPFTAQTRISGLDNAGHVVTKGAVDAILRSAPEAARGTAAAELRRIAEESRARADAAGRGRKRRAAGHRRAQGRDQGRHPRSLCRTAQDGHPHGDDHRRQPADRRRHRRRIRGG